MTDDRTFNNISLTVQEGTNTGLLKINSGGIQWKKQGGGKAVEVDKSDIVGVSWMKVPETNQLEVNTKDGLYKIIGFRDQDVASLSSFFQTTFGKTPEKKQFSVSDRNCRDVDLNGNTQNLSVASTSKQAFEVSLADDSQTRLQGKNDFMLDSHVHDTACASEEFRDKILPMADVGAGVEEAVVTFEGITILTPRDRYNVELHLSFLRFKGQANDFKIQYSSVVSLFLLPRSKQSNKPNFVVISLDPPICEGHPPFIVMQFETDYVVESELSISDELMNTKFKDKLERSYKGLIHEVFTTVLSWLSGAKITKPGKFRSAEDGFAVKSQLMADEGVLYPLDNAFLFLPKHPRLILHDEMDYVEFSKHDTGRGNMYFFYFDLLISLKTGRELLFRNIQRNEYHRLYSFISSKGLKIMNLGVVETTDGVADGLGDNDVDDDAVDPNLERIRNQAADESDDEDDDFVMGEEEDDGSPTDDSGEDDADEISDYNNHQAIKVDSGNDSDSL